MRNYLLLIAFLFYAGISYGASERPVGLNCELISPPDNSGEDIKHGSMIKVYPRAKSISKSYSGCQIMWALMDKKWLMISVSKIAKGDPVTIWSPHEADMERLNCTYSRGELIDGVESKCPVARALLVKSLAPGCVKRSKEVGRLATGCKYE